MVWASVGTQARTTVDGTGHSGLGTRPRASPEPQDAETFAHADTAYDPYEEGKYPMKFTMENLGDSNSYLEVEKKEGWLELGGGYRTSARRALVTGLDSMQAHALASVLEVMAATIERERQTSLGERSG